MSSVVNKSGTRFAPKVRQRRTAPSTPTPTSTSSVRVAPILNEEESAALDEDTLGPLETETAKPDLESASPVENHKESDEPIAKSTQLEETTNSHDTWKSMRSGSILGRHQQRYNRLPSLSDGIGSPMLKSTATDTTIGSRRLSTISKVPKKIRINNLLTEDDDAALKSLKKRKLMRRASVTRKTGSARRISVVSKIEVPKNVSSDEDELAVKLNEHSSLDSDSGEYFERYVVRSIKEIPNDIEKSDSARYLVDEDHFTMEDLCKPTLPIGELSENFDKAINANQAKLKKRKEHRALRQRARTAFKSLQSLNKEEEELEKEKRRKNREKLFNAEIPENGVPKGQQMQLKIGADGKMILDEESTVVDRHKNANLENAQKEKLDENPFENLYNYATYGRNSYTDPWSTEELIKFYKALSMWGTDFNLIAQMFPYRTRRQVKSKFVSEEKKHPVMIELALRSKLPPNFDAYCDDIRKKLGTVDEFNRKIEDLQAEHEKNLQDIQKAKENAKLEDLHTQKEDDLDKKSSGGFKKKFLHSYRKSEVVLGTIDDVKKQRQTEDDIIKEEEKSDDDDGEEDEEEEEEEGVKNKE